MSKLLHLNDIEIINSPDLSFHYFRRRPVRWRFTWRRPVGNSSRRYVCCSFKRTGTLSPCWPIKHRRRHCGVPNCGLHSKRPPYIPPSSGSRRRLERKVCSGWYFDILSTLISPFYLASGTSWECLLFAKGLIMT